ncbi:MAG TPA: hypothetical protein VE078_14230 [Thermoanaerobaculia bacterium]|nr:hypothetical protein [Thermoanaerobaculia bacterium]
MQGSDDRTPTPPVPNAFTRPFLTRFGELDEPPTAGEADVAGPWEVEEIPGFGYGLFRAGETWDRHFQPVAIFHRRPVALLAAAVLPGTGRDAAYRLADKLTPAGFAITDSTGQLAGHSALFDERLIGALHIVETIVSAPESLANLLEAAGSLALERAGAILDQRFPGE